MERSIGATAWSAFFLALAMPLIAQDARIVLGEKVFTTNCSVPYCHGPNGTAGRAPKLVGHNFTARELTTIVSNGINGKGMPAFSSQLSADDLDAVVAYVTSLGANTPATAAPNSAPVRTVPSEALGKALFFDAVRMGGCGRCHELDKRGSRVVDLKNVPADLRAVDASHTVTASPTGEPAFPGFVVEQSEKRVRVFDLSSQLPVLRTFAAAAVKITPGSTWKHLDAARGYTDTELREIAAYLRSAISK